MSHVVSRTYNLTILERINGGFLSKLNFILFTKFPSRRKHYLGRFYVALTLIVSLALNLIPYLLSDLYPVELIALESNIQPFNISTEFIKITSLSPNKTNTDNILLGMALSLDGSIFHNYSVIPPYPKSCTVEGSWIYCPSFPLPLHDLITGYTPESSLANVQEDPNCRTMNYTTPAGEYFEYYVMTSNTMNPYALVEMFAWAANIEPFHTDRAIGSRSLETCLARSLRDNRCVRHSLGFEAFSKEVILVSRRVATQTIVQFITDTASLPLYAEGNKYSIPDCKRLATPMLQTMCSHITSLGYPQRDEMYSIQHVTTSLYNVRYDIVISTLLSRRMLHNWYWSIETISLDIEFREYTTNSTLNPLDFTGRNDSMGLTEDEHRGPRGQELFEATYFVPGTVHPYNHSWANWGFSNEDMENISDFLFGGTMFNNGTLNIIKPDLLANISEVVVGLLFGASLFMVLLGLTISYGTPSIVRNPITEVLYEISAFRKGLAMDDKDKKNSIFTLRKRRVANLVLEPQDDMAQYLKSSISSLAQTPSQYQPQQPYLHQIPAISLRMEVDSDGEEDAIRLLEWKNSRVEQELSHSSLS
ncbi:hypothetical protein BGZ95_000109 [Linnemannia exigua]|uniref:Uncharacterized protein n=1 Tax=Linnemannia exigua TaxID=604196 RepID=A0AAD4H9Y5_9FUNG|nr:hypothetical protein BGZ95_000109 [Linnemannia exigua]